MVIILMGVTGCGKTTVGTLLAEQLGWEFFDADSFHPEANVAKMRNGVPLTEDDRLPWLQSLADLINTAHEEGRNIVLACSALKEKYRELLRHELKPVIFIYLKGGFELIKSRLEARTGHFMDPNLLKSQFAALEEPASDNAICVDISPEPEHIAESIKHALPRTPS